MLLIDVPYPQDVAERGTGAHALLVRRGSGGRPGHRDVGAARARAHALPRRRLPAGTFKCCQCGARILHVRHDPVIMLPLRRTGKFQALAADRRQYTLKKFVLPKKFHRMLLLW